MRTVVSAYYQLPFSKHSTANYEKWITTFLTQIHAPIHMFVGTEEQKQHFQTIRGTLPFHCEVRPFHTLPFQEIDWMNFWKSTMEQDAFKHLHSPEQFIIWNSKSFFVNLAIENNVFSSERFVWCDAGCWRDERVASMVGKSWPIAFRIPDSMVFLDICDISWQRKKVLEGAAWDSINTRNAAEQCIGGTILAGSKRAWLEWIPLYYETLLIYKATGWFAGDDQSVIMSTELRGLAEGKFSVVPRHFPAPLVDGYAGGLGDRWFALQFYLA